MLASIADCKGSQPVVCAFQEPSSTAEWGDLDWPARAGPRRPKPADL